jgi:hypothetical protein
MTLTLQNLPAKIHKRLLKEAGYPTPPLTLCNQEMIDYLKQQVANRVTTEVVAEGHNKELVRFYLDGAALSFWQLVGGELRKPVRESQERSFILDTRFDRVKRENAKTHHIKVSTSNVTGGSHGQTLCGRFAPKKGWSYEATGQTCSKCRRIADAMRGITEKRRITQAEIDHVNELLKA